MSDKEAVEAVAAIVFEAMRFDREDEVPKWAGGNSHAENEARSKAIAIIAAARPHILEEAAKCLEGIADAMEEKAEAIRAQSEPFDPATSDERDAAVTAFEFRRAAAAIRAAKER